MSKASGACLCGAVSFKAENPKSGHGICHCRMCQRWTGGPLFTTTVEKVEFEESGDLKRFASSDWAERGFCSRCGSTLFFRYIPHDMYFLSIGAFDDVTQFKLTEEIFIDKKAPGYDFVGDHPRLTEKETMAKYAPASD